MIARALLLLSLLPLFVRQTRKNIRGVENISIHELENVYVSKTPSGNFNLIFLLHEARNMNETKRNMSITASFLLPRVSTCYIFRVILRSGGAKNLVHVPKMRETGGKEKCACDSLVWWVCADFSSFYAFLCSVCVTNSP